MVFVHSNTHRPRGLVHRCRLRSSWWCRSHQWLGCSSITANSEGVWGTTAKAGVKTYMSWVQNVARQFGRHRPKVGATPTVEVGVDISWECCRLRARNHEYERNLVSAPLVYQLCKASLSRPRATRKGCGLWRAKMPRAFCA